MQNKDLNTMEKELIKDGILTDELIDFFREIDVMNSVGMMAWLTKTAKSGLEAIETGKNIKYHDKRLTKEEYEKIMRENLSDLLVNKIFKKTWYEKLLSKLHIEIGKG